MNSWPGSTLQPHSATILAFHLPRWHLSCTNSSVPCILAGMLHKTGIGLATCGVLIQCRYGGHQVVIVVCIAEIVIFFLMGSVERSISVGGSKVSVSPKEFAPSPRLFCIVHVLDIVQSSEYMVPNWGLCGPTQGHGTSNICYRENMSLHFSQ